MALSLLGGIVGAGGPARAEEVIRLDAVSHAGVEEPAPLDPSGGLRRGFDYDQFFSRLEALWVSRKIALAQGRREDAARQAELLRVFCDEEGVVRLRGIADALLIEAERSAEQGSYGAALDALDLAETLDAGRGQIRFARAGILWSSGRGAWSAGREMIAGAVSGVRGAWRDLSLVNSLALWLVLGAALSSAAFALLAIAGHQAALRHELAEWLGARGLGTWSGLAGWGVVLAPLALWFAAGWVVPYWIAITFRYMRRNERVAAVIVLAVLALAIPAYGAAVGVYGVTTDPEIRATLDASTGPYTPERVVTLRELAQARPDEAIYNFLLAGLYKSGRYFEDAFQSYKAALALDPRMDQAWINIGNLYHATGQYNEAIANYQRALEVRGDSALAYYNLHLSQAESFRFKEAKESLARARAIDAVAVDAWMRSGPGDAMRASIVDARIDVREILSASLTGRKAAGPQEPRIGVRWANGLGAAAILALSAALTAASTGRPRAPASRCTRCGRPFCSYCRGSRDPHAYCSQCLHLFVVGDGLAPETKQLKLYEVERHERNQRRWRRTAGLLIPGSAQVLRGRAVRGVALMTVWFAGWCAAWPPALQILERASGFDFGLGWLRTGEVPARFAGQPWVVVGAAVLAATWVSANLPVLRRREA